MFPRLGNSVGLLLGACAMAAAVAAGPAWGQEAEAHPGAPQLALMGTIPIYWGEAAGFDELVNGDAHRHWARAALEQEFELVPLDFLSAEALAGKSFLMMAQPRALAPEENVALDAWVRDGGKLLLFVDPMMTGHSRFSLGDRRRPMDVALLSPILAHWGLELQFDDQQEAGLAMLDHFAVEVPVNLPGEFVPVEDRFECVVSGEGILAHCALDAGEVLALADAALLDLAGPHQGAPKALHMLTSHLFGPFGDEWGNARHEHGKTGDQAQNPHENHGHGDHGESASPT